MGTRYADHVTPLYPQKLALTSPTVGIVRVRTKATESILTSHRDARCVIELLQYDNQICHITGPSNYLADVLSRNPAGLTENDLRDVRQPANLIVHAVNLNIDPGVTHELKDLAGHQAADRLVRITNKLN